MARPERDAQSASQAIAMSGEDARGLAHQCVRAAVVHRAQVPRIEVSAQEDEILSPGRFHVAEHKWRLAPAGVDLAEDADLNFACPQSLAQLGPDLFCHRDNR